MRRLLLLSFLLVLSAPSAPYVAQESLTFGRFGTVVVYRESPHPSHVALFVSSDEGWSQTVSDMARVLSSLDALVVGIDIRHYRQELETSSEWCSYPGGDFAALSKFVQKTLGFPNYVLPVLVGYGSGATLVYATLAQAPPDMFRGVLSLGFCPDLPLTKPLCQWYSLQWKPGPQRKGYSLLPAPTLQAPWTVLQGASDQVCDATAVETYVKQIPQAEFLLLPQSDDGFSQAANWMPQLRAAFTKLLEKPEAIQAPQAEAMKDLPLVEIPAIGLTAICQASETAKTTSQLVQEFRQLLHHREGEKLDAWLAKCTASQIREFQSFVQGVERDKAAVVAGLTLSQNNDLVEGKVNKLKLIKRMGYGRAGFPLLRQRVLHAL